MLVLYFNSLVLFDKFLISTYMKHKLLGILLSLILCSGFVQSQSLSPSVISSSGGFYTSASAMLSFTVAEMTMVQTFTSGSNILTQGFQQPEDLTVGITENTVSSGEMVIYPNPTHGVFTLSFNSLKSGENTIKLYNLVGQEVMKRVISQTTGANTIAMDIGSLSQGIYMLEMKAVNTKGEMTTNYCKINLVY